MTIVTCPGCGAKNRLDERAGQMQPVCGRCGTKLPAVPAAGSAGDGRPVTLTDSTFDQLALNTAAKPVLVDAWAPWCGPCRLVGPIIDQIAAESSGRYLIAKLNIDENPRTAERFNISSIPTLLLFKDGKLVDRMIGAQPKKLIESRLRALA
jgi:thioredoxin 2